MVQVLVLITGTNPPRLAAGVITGLHADPARHAWASAKPGTPAARPSGAWEKPASQDSSPRPRRADPAPEDLEQMTS